MSERTLRAYTVTVKVPASRTIRIHLPDEVPEGDVEVIVRYQPADEAIVSSPPSALEGPQRGSREAILAAKPALEAWRAANPDKLMTGEEIDRQLAAERASWGDER